MAVGVEQQGIPAAADLEALFVAGHGGTGADVRDEFAAAVVDLHASNLFQWRCESEIRSATLEAAEVAALKRAIDGSNARRARLVERLDELCLARLRPAGTSACDAYINSETIGQLVDRLSILTLKLFFVRARAARADAGDAAAARYAEHVAQLEAQRAYVATCYDRFLEHLRTGSASMPTFRQFKFYVDGDL